MRVGGALFIFAGACQLLAHNFALAALDFAVGLLWLTLGKD